MRGGRPLLEKELMEVFAARRQHGFVCTKLFAFDQQSDVTELIVEPLVVELVQHGLAVFGQELIHLALAVHLEETHQWRLHQPETQPEEQHHTFYWTEVTENKANKRTKTSSCFDVDLFSLDLR